MAPFPRKRHLPRGCQIGCGALAALFLLLIVIAATHMTITPTTQATQPTRAISTPTKEKPTSMPTSQPTHTIKPTQGTPTIGGPLSDFYGKFGNPTTTGVDNSPTWIVDQDQQTLVNARADAQGRVTAVLVTSGANWSNQQTKQYCSQFLPSDARQFNTVSNLFDYHSNVGDIAMQLEPASCTLTLMQS